MAKRKIRTSGRMVLVNPRHRGKRRGAGRRRARGAVRTRRMARRSRKVNGRARSRARKVGYRYKNPRRARRVARRRPVLRRRARLMRRKARVSVARRRRVIRRRRNPSSGGPSMLRKIPVVGPLLASAFGFLAPAAAGAVSVIPTVKAMQLATAYIPGFAGLPAPVAYGATGVILGAIANRYLPIDPTNRKLVATAIAAAAGGVGAYKLMQGEGDLSAESEMAGFGPEWVENLGSTLVYGDVESLGDLGGLYTDATLADACFCADDMSPRERQALGAMTASQIKRAFPVARQAPHPLASRHAGQPVHQFGWLAALIGERVHEVARLPDHERRQLIAQLREQAIQTVQAELAHEGKDLGALLAA